MTHWRRLEHVDFVRPATVEDVFAGAGVEDVYWHRDHRREATSVEGASRSGMAFVNSRPAGPRRGTGTRNRPATPCSSPSTRGSPGGGSFSFTTRPTLAPSSRPSSCVGAGGTRNSRGRCVRTSLRNVWGWRVRTPSGKKSTWVTSRNAWPRPSSNSATLTPSSGRRIAPRTPPPRTPPPPRMCREKGGGRAGSNLRVRVGQGRRSCRDSGRDCGNVFLADLLLRPPGAVAEGRHRGSGRRHVLILAGILLSLVGIHLIVWN